jgi:hypothetical protein
MIDVCKKNSFNQQEYVKLSKKVGNINRFIDQDGVAKMVIEGMQEVDLSFKARIFHREDSREAERLAVAEYGKEYLEHMLKNIDGMVEYSK